MSYLQVRAFFAASYSNQLQFYDEAPCYWYYMEKKAQVELLEENLTLPEGYHFYEIMPEADAPFINDTWKYASPREFALTRH